MSRQDIAERFQRETANHEMTIRHDDGLYRHLRFRHPKRGTGWFDLITVPHALIFRGDGESFVFDRMDDMFEFFRSGIWQDGSLHVNPDYWAEKLTSNEDAVWTYSQDRFNEHVAEGLREAEADYPGVTQAWNDKVNGFFAEYNTEYEETARDALDDFRYPPEGEDGEPFRFTDTSDWELRDYDWWFLWALHGIVWGIAQYDAKRAAEQASAPVEAVAG